MDIDTAERLADNLIFQEIAKQDKMWGRINERADTSKGQLLQAALAQAGATHNRINGDAAAFDTTPGIYPADWSGFRDYGSDIANLVVAIAYLRQEVKRKLLNGEDRTRTSRKPEQAYNPATGLPSTQA